MFFLISRITYVPIVHALKSVARLIDKGANVNHADRDGETPLLIAARIGSVKLCDLLLDAGALVNVSDVKGNSPLTLAAGASDCEGM